MTTSPSSQLKLRWLVIFLTLILMIGLVAWLTWWWVGRQIQTPLASRPEVASPKPVIVLPSRIPSQVPVFTSTPTPFVTLTLTPTGSPTLSPATTPIPSSTSIPLLTSTPTPTNLPAITNGNFTHGLTAWQTQGEVKILPVLAIDSPTQASETFLARLGSQTNLAWLGTHQLSQTFLLNPEVATLRFWYRLWTEETNLGFDDPALVVMLDDQVIWRMGAATAWSNNANVLSLADSMGQPVTTGWKLISLPLTKFVKANQSHVLRFLAGQTGDQSLATWAEISQVSLVATLPEPELAIPNWWPAAVSLEWSQFVQPATLIGSLPDIESTTTWQELFHRLQTPVVWQSHTLTNLGNFQVQSWRPADWLIDAAKTQPTFTFPFSLSHEGFTGPLVTATSPENSQALPMGTPWSGWTTVWNLLGKPQGLIWLDERWH